MSDVIIFGFGCFVSLIIASAVGLLFWGAANESRGSTLPAKEPDPAERQTRPTPPEPTSALSLESKSLA